MKGGQLIPYALPDVTWAAGGRAQTSLKDIPPTIQGRHVHLVGIDWEVDVDPTFTTAPTVQGLNSVVASLKISDGRNQRFDGNFNYLRVFEALENGGPALHPDPDLTSGSGNNFYFGRSWKAGPEVFEGAPTDFAIPVAALKNGVISYTFGALTDISADTTAATVTLRATAQLLLLDEVRVPPVVERLAFDANSKDVVLQGAALYPFLAALNSSGVDAIAAGDFGAFTVIGSKGEIISNIDAEVLGRSYAGQMASGIFSLVQGEPRASTDDNHQTVTSGSIAKSTAAIQPVLWCTPNALLTKIVAETDSGLRVKWSGSQASGVLLATRILEQPMTAIATVAAAALQGTGRSISALEPKTLSKKPYSGPRPAYMPYKVTAR